MAHESNRTLRLCMDLLRQRAAQIVNRDIETEREHELVRALVAFMNLCSRLDRALERAELSAHERDRTVAHILGEGERAADPHDTHLTPEAFTRELPTIMLGVSLPVFQPLQQPPQPHESAEAQVVPAVLPVSVAYADALPRALAELSRDNDNDSDSDACALPRALAALAELSSDSDSDIDSDSESESDSDSENDVLETQYADGHRSPPRSPNAGETYSWERTSQGPPDAPPGARGNKRRRGGGGGGGAGGTSAAKRRLF